MRYVVWHIIAVYITSTVIIVLRPRPGSVYGTIRNLDFILLRMWLYIPNLDFTATWRLGRGICSEDCSNPGKEYYNEGLNQGKGSEDGRVY